MILALIPARYASTRFPGKPLAPLGGREMILHVCDRLKAAGIQSAVATDDPRIEACVAGAGYRAVMTSAAHRSGTDRIAEALAILSAEADFEKPRVVVNVQGDEPFVNPTDLKRLAATFDDPEVQIATLVRPYEGAYAALEDENLVKVVRGSRGNAIYFSRSVVPSMRGVPREEWPGKGNYLTHIGVYAYRPEVLQAVTRLPECPLERSERLEQLRWLDAGYRIATVETDSQGIGIDTPADLENAEKLFKSKHTLSDFC